MSEKDYYAVCELRSWPAKERMAKILSLAGLHPVVGPYSIRLQDCPTFVFQQYGGDLGDPVIEADADTLSDLCRDAGRISEALTRVRLAHRFEIYDGEDDEAVEYLHYDWPLEMSVGAEVEEIETLTTCEAIRRRPKSYLPPGVNRRNYLVLEALCLSLAEAHCGTCTEIHIAVSGRSAVITDNGLGLSLEAGRDGRTFAERIFSDLYACRDHKAHHEIAHDLCGAGIVVVNALCESFSVEVHTGGFVHRMTFRDGVKVQPFQMEGPSRRTGTVLRMAITEQFAPEEFDIDGLRAAIHAKPVDLSRTAVTVTGEPLRP